MTEFDRQKKSNAPIMQAYHGVDVLIIDDIQNIIGKRASVDYFFPAHGRVHPQQQRRSSSRQTVPPRT